MKPVHALAWLGAAAVVATLGMALAGRVNDAPSLDQALDASPPMALVQAKQAGQAVSSTKVEPLRAETELADLRKRLAAELRGEAGDLSQTLRQLGRRCNGLAPSACINEVVAGLPAAERGRLSDLLARLPLLGPHLSALVMSTRQPMLERIDAVSRARAQVLGSDNARLLFGREEAQLRYQAQLDDFVQREAAGLPLPQRLVVAEALRPAELTVQDSATERARRYDLTLRLTLLDANTEADKARLTREVRSRFFPPEQVEQLAQADRFDVQQRDRMATYAERKRAIHARFADASDPAALQQRDAELAALRQEVFPDSFQPH
jgi:hypothetical protein